MTTTKKATKAEHLRKTAEAMLRVRFWRHAEQRAIRYARIGALVSWDATKCRAATRRAIESVKLLRAAARQNINQN